MTRPETTTCVDCGRKTADADATTHDMDAVCPSCEERRAQRLAEGSDCMLAPPTHAPCVVCREVKPVCCCPEGNYADGGYVNAVCRTCCEEHGGRSPDDSGTWRAFGGSKVLVTCTVCSEVRPVCCSALIMADGSRVNARCARCCDHAPPKSRGGVAAVLVLALALATGGSGCATARTDAYGAALKANEAQMSRLNRAIRAARTERTTTTDDSGDCTRKVVR